MMVWIFRIEVLSLKKLFLTKRQWLKRSSWKKSSLINAGHFNFHKAVSFLRPGFGADVREFSHTIDFTEEVSLTANFDYFRCLYVSDLVLRRLKWLIEGDRKLWLVEGECTLKEVANLGKKEHDNKHVGLLTKVSIVNVKKWNRRTNSLLCVTNNYTYLLYEYHCSYKQKIPTAKWIMSLILYCLMTMF